MQDNQPTLKLDLVLNNQGLSLVLNLLGEFGRDGMVSSRVLHNEALVALHPLVHMRLFNRPFSNVGPFFLRTSCVLLCVGGLPPGIPAIGELFDEVGLDTRGLQIDGSAYELEDGTPNQVWIYSWESLL